MQEKTDRRSFLSQVAAATTMLSSTPAAFAAQPATVFDATHRPHIFYLCVDDLGTYLNCYGNTQVVSPHFDAFAKDAVLFENAHCQVAVCTASRTSILTGVRPEDSGLTGTPHDWKAAMPAVRSLPEQLQVNGYTTIGVGKIWDPRSGAGNNLGWTKQGDNWGIQSNTRVFRALDEHAKSDQPLAAFIGYFAPHCPWSPAPEFLDLYAGVDIHLNGPGRYVPGKRRQRCFGVQREHITDDDARDMTRRYYASVSQVDALIGECLDWLKRAGLYDDSIIVLWSGDNGFHLGENGIWGKWTCFRASTNVPLLIKTPRMSSAGKRCSAVVECVDLYPTLLDLAGLPLPAHVFGGHSLQPLLKDPTMNVSGQSWDDAAYSLWEAEHPNRCISVKTQRYNYIRYVDHREFLFDLAIDRGEANNIAREETGVVARLNDRLSAHFAGHYF